MLHSQFQNSNPATTPDVGATSGGFSVLELLKKYDEDALVAWENRFEKIPGTTNRMRLTNKKDRLFWEKKCEIANRKFLKVTQALCKSYEKNT